MRITLGTLLNIQKAVKQAEGKFKHKQNPLDKVIHREWAYLHTDGPRRPIHHVTPYQELLNHVKILNISPESKAGVLGSGLGMASYTLASRVKDVTGWEIDPEIYAEAEGIRQSFNISNISFIKDDFLTGADLSTFSLIYFYKPFTDNFIEVMGEKLKETVPGTIVISRRFCHIRTFNPSDFLVIHPKSLDITSLESILTYKDSEFFTFKRI